MAKKQLAWYMVSRSDCHAMYYALINGLVDDALWDACPSVNEVLLQASDVMNKYLVHMFLHPKSCSQMGLGLDCLVVATDLTRW